MAGVVEVQRPAPKKRRVSKVEEDDDSKKRGRPRVERNDESAADRRRTQIRMAQRAYRQRKESTLEELRKRVDELSGVVDSMESVFQECMHRLVSTGLSDIAINELRVTAARFAGLRAASQHKEMDLSDTEHVLKPATATTTTTQPTSPPTAQPEDALTPKNVSIWLDQTELSRPLRRPRVDDYLGLGYSIILPEGQSEEQAFYSWRPQLMKTTTGAINIPIGSPDLLKAQRLQAAGTQLPNELRTPKTFSFQETSFARRVHRACLEAGYSLLLDPARNLQAYERVFRLPLLGRDRMQLVACTREVLNRGPTESLDLYEAPLIHVGGAGTHYARRDKNGNMVARKVAYSLGMVGPQTLKLLMQADEERLTADMAVEIEGFEGEWFDPYDVEGYLVEKGIVIDAGSSFTEVEVPASMRCLGDSSRHASRASTPGLTNTSDGPISFKSLENFDMGVVWNPFPDFDIPQPVGSATNTAAWMDDLQKVPAVPDSAKKMVMVDVQRLIRGLMMSAVCLGQTPGFRRKDVDRALAYACFEL